MLVTFLLLAKKYKMFLKNNCVLNYNQIKFWAQKITYFRCNLRSYMY